ncbi:MAG: hypothetical protein JOZ43_01140 [Acidobacteriales bacterium]|nr:hypothetical protein [Terriglobales bacterium]
MSTSSPTKAKTSSAASLDLSPAELQTLTSVPDGYIADWRPFARIVPILLLFFYIVPTLLQFLLLKHTPWICALAGCIVGFLFLALSSFWRLALLTYVPLAALQIYLIDGKSDYMQLALTNLIPLAVAIYAIAPPLHRR